MSPALKDVILEKGFYIFDNFFDPAKFNLLAAVHNNPKTLVLEGGNRSRYVRLLESDPIFANLILDTGITDIARGILGKHISISDYQLLTLHPGAAPVNVHLDYPFVMMDEIFVNPIAQIQTLWILDDFTEHNGATRIVPYSHLNRRWPEAKEFDDSFKELHLKKGSVLVFHGALWHATAGNNSDADRSSVLMAFSPPWIKSLIEINRDISKSFPLQIRQMLGETNHKILGENVKSKQYEEYTIRK